MACENSEDLHGDREQWRRTARALFALHGGPEEVISVAGMREGKRAIANQAARVLVEMALLTCPERDGRVASWSDSDFLTTAIVALLAGGGVVGRDPWRRRGSAAGRATG
jgi:hypothetical protein